MRNELYINLGFVGHHAEIFQELFREYSKEPKANKFGSFLRFENYSELVCNQGVMCHTNCFENEEHFMSIFHGKLLWKFLENSEKKHENILVV